MEIVFHTLPTRLQIDLTTWQLSLLSRKGNLGLDQRNHLKQYMEQKSFELISLWLQNCLFYSSVSRSPLPSKPSVTAYMIQPSCTPVFPKEWQNPWVCSSPQRSLGTALKTPKPWLMCFWYLAICDLETFNRIRTWYHSCLVPKLEWFMDGQKHMWYFNMGDCTPGVCPPVCSCGALVILKNEEISLLGFYCQLTHNSPIMLQCHICLSWCHLNTEVTQKPTQFSASQT